MFRSVESAGLISFHNPLQVIERQLAEAEAHVKAEGWNVSVDSMSADELLRGGRAGADYLLSLKLETLWIADEVASVPVLIASDQADMATQHLLFSGFSVRIAVLCSAT